MSKTKNILKEMMVTLEYGSPNSKRTEEGDIQISFEEMVRIFSLLPTLEVKEDITLMIWEQALIILGIVQVVEQKEVQIKLIELVLIVSFMFKINDLGIITMQLVSELEISISQINLVLDFEENEEVNYLSFVNSLLKELGMNKKTTS